MRISSFALAEAFPDLDDTTLRDTLEGISHFDELIGAVIRSALEDQLLLEALNGRLVQMKGRRDRLLKRVEVKRALALKAMLDGDLTRVEQPDFLAFPRKAPPAVEIDDSALIPAAFWKPQPPLLDRAELKRALQAGQTVAGASLAEPRLQLSVRTH